MDARAFGITSHRRMGVARKGCSFDVDHTIRHAMHEFMKALEFVFTGKKEAGYS